MSPPPPPPQSSQPPPDPPSPSSSSPDPSVHVVPSPHTRASRVKGVRGAIHRAIAKRAPPWLTLIEEAFSPGP